MSFCQDTNFTFESRTANTCHIKSTVSKRKHVGIVNLIPLNLLFIKRTSNCKCQENKRCFSKTIFKANCKINVIYILRWQSINKFQCWILWYESFVFLLSCIDIELIIFMIKCSLWNLFIAIHIPFHDLWRRHFKLPFSYMNWLQK